MLLLIAAVFTALTGKAAEKPDAATMVQYAALAIVLTGLTIIRVPGVAV